MTRKPEVKTSQQTLELRKILNNKKLDTEDRLRLYAETQHSKILKKSLRKKLMSEAGHAVEDFLPYQIIFHPAEMFKDMSIKELHLLLKLFADIDQGGYSNQKIKPAYHAIGGAIGILQNIVKP